MGIRLKPTLNLRSLRMLRQVRGLSGGGVGGAVTVNLEAAKTNELGGVKAANCAAGEVVTGISEQGTLLCADDANSGGDITNVTAGTGLSGGGTSGAVTVNLQAAADNELGGVKSGSCSSGQKVTGISTSGTVTCGTDANSGGDITEVAVSGGVLTGGATSGKATVTLEQTAIGGVFDAADYEVKGNGSGSPLAGPGATYTVNGFDPGLYFVSITGRLLWNDGWEELNYVAQFDVWGELTNNGLPENVKVLRLDGANRPDGEAPVSMSIIVRSEFGALYFRMNDSVYLHRVTGISNW